MVQINDLTEKRFELIGKGVQGFLDREPKEEYYIHIFTADSSFPPWVGLSATEVQTRNLAYFSHFS